MEQTRRSSGGIFRGGFPDGLNIHVMILMDEENPHAFDVAPGDTGHFSKGFIRQVLGQFTNLAEGHGTGIAKNGAA